MNSKDIQRIAVIGAGQMGHQIGMLCALGGYETIIQDMNEQSLIDAKDKLEAIIGKWVQKGKISSEAKEAAFRRLSFTNTLKEAISNADFRTNLSKFSTIIIQFTTSYAFRYKQLYIP